MNNPSSSALGNTASILPNALFFHPLMSQWHPNKNTGVDPKKITHSSSKKVWWLGTCGHEWEASVGNRVKGSGCLYCTNQKVLVGFNDLATTNPVLASEWHPTKNGPLAPQQVTKGSEKKVWWLGTCGHDWEAVIHARNGRNIGCPICSGNKILVGFNDLATTNPVLASEWHPTKNGPLTAHQVSKSTNKKVWWLCALGHEWDAGIADRNGRNIGCPVCSNRRVLVGSNDLASTNPVLASEWHPTKNGSLTPYSIVAGSAKKVWWLCALGHEWKTTCVLRTAGRGCPVCSGNIILVGFNDLATTNPVLASEWHPTKNGSLALQQVSRGMNKQVWWLGSCGHEWAATVVNRASHGSGCPMCVYHISKAELELHDFIVSLNVGDVVQSDKSILSGRELDIYIPSRNLAIEFNGLYWHSEKRGKDKFYHYDKWLACKEQGIQLIQVWEDDWSKNSELLKSMISHKLGISSKEKIAGRKTKGRLITNVEAKEFLVANHLQGYRNSSKHYGLFSKDKLVSILSVTLTSDKKEMEIIRFASSAVVVGGFSKLLKFALKDNIEVSMVKTYSHNDYATGGVYAANGFRSEHEGTPGYSYVVDAERVHRLNFMKAKFKSNKSLLYQEDLSERELADLNGLDRIWDSGSSLWIMEL